MQIKKSRKTTITEPVPETKRIADERLAWAAGTERFQHRDPLYHVTEDFQQTFDRIGRAHARSAAGGFQDLRTESERMQSGRSGEKEKAAGQAERQKSASAVSGKKEKERGGPKLWTGNVPSALTEFSETAFQRGSMSAAVLNGTGKMMLVSCLKRSVGESGPKRLQQQSVFGTGSQMRNIPGRSPDQMVFNRGFTGGALGIVVDTLRDARRVVDSMTDMAIGTGELAGGDNAALLKMYPFLDDSRDAALEAEYRKKLADSADEREKPVLQNALVQVISLRAKKAQMKNEFINKLRFISDRASETLSELETPGIVDELVASAFGEAAPDLPENPDEGEGDDAPDGSKNRNNKADAEGGAAAAAGPAEAAH